MNFPFSLYKVTCICINRGQLRIEQTIYVTVAAIEVLYYLYGGCNGASHLPDHPENPGGVREKTKPYDTNVQRQI